MEYYSALKYELTNHEKTLRKCKCILLSEKRKPIIEGYTLHDSNCTTSGKGTTTVRPKGATIARVYPQEYGRKRQFTEDV